MKKLVSILLILTTLLGIGGCSLEHFSFDRDKNIITRAEWAELLGKHFGMDSCLSDTPYYNDVDATKPYFAYVQSGAEWEVYDISSKSFEPDKPATVEFVVASAIEAAEIDWRSSATPVDFARKNGIKCEKPDSKADSTFAEEVVLWALDRYQNREFVEYENIKYKDDLIHVMAEPDENGKIIIDEGDFAVGDVIVTPGNAENPDGIALKIASITTNKKGQLVIETVEPDIGDVFDELDFAYIGTVSDTSTIRTAEGVTLVDDTKQTAAESRGNGFAVHNLMHRTEEGGVNAKPMASKGKDFSFSIKLAKGGKVTFTPQYGAIKAEIERGDNEEAKKIFEETGFAQVDDLHIQGDVQTLKATDKYSKGWEIEGGLALKNFYVETAIETKKAFGIPYGIKSYKFEVHYEVVPSLHFKGSYEEEITIATVPIPIGSLGITVDVEIFAKGSVNGDVEISAKLSNTSTVEYSEKNGYKKTQSSQKEHSAKISVDFRIGFGAKATLKALGIKLIDFKIEIGMGFEIAGKITKVVRIDEGIYKYDGAVAEMSGATTDTIICLSGTGYLPTISLSIGTSKGTLANKIGLKFTWKIMDKSGATFKSEIIPLHYEFGKGLVEECTLDNLTAYDEKDIEEALNENRDETKDDVGREVMDISKYALVLEAGESSELSITALPYGYTGYDLQCISADFSIVNVTDIKAKENGFSCTVKAASPGVTSVVIVSKDGKHMVRCAVIVKSSENTEFTPLG